MPKKITGTPRFTHLQLMKLTVDRGPTADGSEAVMAYVSEKTHEMFGSVTIAQNSQIQHFSKKSQELLSKLVDSLEEDAARQVFSGNEPEETKQEGIHVQEPKGIVDAEEEAPQV